MKKILLSILSIAIVSAVAIGGSQAFFSDSETSLDNVITAGSIDISLDGENPFSSVEHDEIKDMKPSYVRWTKHVVKNVGTNPVRLWKHIMNVRTDNNGWSEPECTDEQGTWLPEENGTCTNEQEPVRSRDNIDEYIEYDMYIGGKVVGDDGQELSEDNNWFGGHNENGRVIVSEEDGITLDDVESWYIYLGELAPKEDIIVWQSYHMKDETGNWAQTDTATFDMEFYAEQVNGTGPQSDTLFLDNKTANWDPIIGDGMWGVLKWAGDGLTFDFSTTLEAHGLAASTSYSLIYYADPWPGNNPGALLGTGTSDASGDLSISGSPDLGIDLPDPADANYPGGAKIWLVLSSDYDGAGNMTDWNPSDYLFEYNLITYDDTDA